MTGESSFTDPAPSKGSPLHLTDGQLAKLIFEVEDYAFVVLSSKGIITSWNKGAEKIKGYEPDEIIGKHFSIFYPLEDREANFPERLLEKVRIEGKVHHEGWKVKKNGERFWGSVVINAIAGENDTISGFLKITRDLTERRIADDRHNNFVEALRLKNEELLQEQKKYHAMISELEGYALIQLDVNGKILDWNKGAEKLKGYQPHEIIGKNFRLFYSEEDRADNLPQRILSEAVAAGSYIHEGYRIRKDGTRFWANVTVTALKTETGELYGFVKITKDLTQEKMARDRLRTMAFDLHLTNSELKKSEERYHKMISEVEDYAILLLDKNGTIQNWNAGAEFIKGYKQEEAIGRNFRIFYRPEDVSLQLPELLLAEATRSGKAVSEGWRVKKDGTKFWALVVITALHNDDGEIIGFSKVTRDLTTQKAAQDQLLASSIDLERKNQRLEILNQELSSYAYVVSHDLKEPLRKVEFFANRQLEKGKPLEQIFDYTERIISCTSGMRKMMDDLIAYSQMTPDISPTALVDLNAVVLEAQTDLELLIYEKKGIIDCATLPTIKGISFQLHQLFLNLFSNALKFSKVGVQPIIEIRAQAVSGKDVPFTAGDVDRYFLISITDNGIGFSNEHRHRIFEVFKRLQSKAAYGGSGIGLAIVKRVMMNHNGFVEASAEENAGTVFKLYFPSSPH